MSPAKKTPAKKAPKPGAKGVQGATKARVKQGGKVAVPGIRLINMLEHKLIDEDLPDRHIADLLGVTRIYWNAILAGRRSITMLPQPKMRKLAEFLNISLIQTYMLADFFESADLELREEVVERVNASRTKMAQDKSWAHMAPTPEAWKKLDWDTKKLISTMYEHMTSEVFKALTSGHKLH